MQRVRQLVLGCWVLCAILCMAHPAYAMPVIEVAPGTPHAQPLRDFEYLIDADRKWSIDDIRALPAERFSSLHGQLLNKGFSDKHHWLRATVRNASSVPSSWVMQHTFAPTDYVDYWIFKDGRLVMHAVGGDRTSLAERQIPFHLPSIRYTSQPGETAELYIRLRNSKPSIVYLSFVIDSAERFLAKMGSIQLLFGMLYGIPLALAISVMAGWAIAGVRSGLVPVYVFYVLSVLGSWMGMNGHLGQYIFPGQPDLTNSMQPIFLLLTTVSMAMFARGFLQTKENMPKFDWFFKIMIGMAVIGMILRLAGVYAFVSQLAMTLTVGAVATPIAAWIAWKKGVIYARWYFFAQLLYTVAVAMGLIGIRFERIYYEYLFMSEFSFFGELLLLGVAQQDRMRILKNERVLVEQRYKAALEESNAELEREVYERTRTLQEAYKRTQFLGEVKIATRRIANGEFSVRLQEGDAANMRDLAESVNSMAESLSRLEGARRRWIAEISHELRTPLFALMCETEALLDGVRTLNKRAIGSLHEEILRLSLLVSDLHELALSYLRPLPCTFTSWRLNDVAHKLTKRYVDQAQAKGLTFALHADEGQRTVSWDKGRIEQLLSNLVNNSISYTDAPGTISMTITATAERAFISIEDSPPGVSAEEAQHLFEPLYRADAARSRRSGGSGLGLSICQAIVHAHGGHIMAARSSLGGLAIRIDLPLVIKENGRKSTQDIDRG